MPKPIDVFVSYSHPDARYLERDSLLGFLRGLESEGLRFWTDREIAHGELWDAVIKQRLQASPIALVLVSQGFLDSEYCQQVEIRTFLAHKTHLLPVILSPCEWQRHAWLSSRQFLPKRGRTLEEHYRDAGDRKRLFLEIREQLRQRAERLRGESTATAPGIAAAPGLTGRDKVELQRRLGDDWRALADQLGIPSHDQRRFEAGFEGRGIWEWLENRGRLAELGRGLTDIGREDLAGRLGQGQ